MEYNINNFREKRFGDKYFLTTDHGSYCVLNTKEFKKLKQNNIDEELKKKLEEKEIILNQENINEAIRLTRNRNSFIFHGTSLHIIVATLRCNMKCAYCHASSKSLDDKKFDMDTKTAEKTVDFIFETPNNSISIEFQGGEPLLNWDIIKFIVKYALEKNKAAKKNLFITMVTNLSLMDEEKMDYIIKNNVSICTSLDGPKELHDFNRKFIGKSNYEDVKKWIKKFNSEYKKRKTPDIAVNGLVTITKKSLSYPKEIVDEYIASGIKTIHLRYLNNLGVAKTAWNSISYTIEDFLKFWNKAARYIEEKRKEGIDVQERMVQIMFNKINNEFDPNYLDLRSPCGAVIGQLTYNYNGDIYTCDEARMIDEDLFLLGNVKKDNYKKIVTCNKACATISASINDQYICNNCVYKPYCGVCPVINYTEQGSIIGKIPQTERCKIFMEQFNWVVKEKFINQED